MLFEIRLNRRIRIPQIPPAKVAALKVDQLLVDIVARKAAHMDFAELGYLGGGGRNRHHLGNGVRPIG
jgi:hypothetical protein